MHRCLFLLTGFMLCAQVRVTTRLIEVNVVVEGQRDVLHKEDFTVLDNGKPASVAVFRPPAAAKPLEAVNLPAGVYSNRYEKRAPNVSILLFDMLNTPPDQRADAQRQMVRMLDQVEGEHRIALLALGNGLALIHGFTDDPRKLKQLLQQFGSKTPIVDRNPAASGMIPMTGIGSAPFNIAEAQMNQMLTQQSVLRRFELTQEALEAIARNVRSIAGRKNLIWVSAGFPIQLAGRGGFSLQPDLLRLAKLLDEADLAVYPVQTGGLSTNLNLGVSSAGRRPAAINSTEGPRNGTMRTLADETGGRAFFGSNDIGHAIQTALQDSANSYTLGFYANDDNLDGKFHEIKVAVKGKRNVRHRRGYYALSDAPPEPVEQAVARVLSSPLESSAIGMSVRIDPSDQPQPDSWRLLVGVDIGKLQLHLQQGKKAGAVQLLVVQVNDKGQGIGTLSDTVRLDLTLDQHRKMLEDGLVLVKNVARAPGAETLRIVVIDLHSQVFGSVHIPVAR